MSFAVNEICMKENESILLTILIAFPVNSILKNRYTDWQFSARIA
jgi:hypothetical protein